MVFLGFFHYNLTIPRLMLQKIYVWSDGITPCHWVNTSFFFIGITPEEDTKKNSKSVPTLLSKNEICMFCSLRLKTPAIRAIRVIFHYFSSSSSSSFSFSSSSWSSILGTKFHSNESEKKIRRTKKEWKEKDRKKTRLIDWLIDWYVNWLIDWLTDLRKEK